MFGSIGGAEFLLIAVLALLLFGPRKLPQIGRSLGRALAEFRGVTHEFKSSLEREVEVEELRRAGESITDAGREISNSVREAARSTVPRAPSGAPRDAGVDTDGEQAGSNDAAARPPGSSDGQTPT
jgi:Tat protein translocase TatB subunit